MASVSVFESPRGSGRWIAQLTTDPPRSPRPVKSRKTGVVTWQRKPKVTAKAFGRGTSAQNRKKAELQRSLWQADIERGDYVASNRVTMSTLLDDFMAGVRLKHRPSTVACYQNQVEKHVRPALGHLAVKDVEYLDLVRFYRSLPPATARLAHVVVRLALKMAVRAKLVKQNVAVDAADELPQPEERPDDPTANCWTEEELLKVYAYAHERATPMARAILLFMLDSGCRGSEVRGAQWRDLANEAGCEFHVTRQVLPSNLRRTAKEAFVRLKSGGLRKITLEAGTVAALVAHRKAQRKTMLGVGPDKWFRGKGPEGERLIFANELTGAPLSRDFLVDTIRRAAKGAGVRCIKPHGTRHTCITHRLALGIAPHVVAKHVGATTAVIEKHYAHALPGFADDAAQRWARLVGRASR